MNIKAGVLIGVGLAGAGLYLTSADPDDQYRTTKRTIGFGLIGIGAIFAVTSALAKSK